MSELLAVRGLRVRYGKLETLHGVDITVEQNAACVVLGPNGAGKTTLLRGISGFEKWETGRVCGGSVTFEGHEIQGRDASSVARGGLQLVPERQAVFLQLTVRENLQIASAGHAKRPGFAEMRDLVSTLFPVLAKRAAHAAGLLSGGERQMLGLALRLLAQPKMLLLDEISFGLAPAAVRMMFAALGEVKRRSNIAMLIVEQNIAAAMNVADYVYVLSNGRIESQGTAAEMRDNKAVYEQYVGVGKVRT
jgi:branched-chain amino acid transport system ATP-binding protein